MVSLSKEVRRELVDSDNPRSRYSMNQTALHQDRESERRFFGYSHKGTKAELRRARERVYQEEFPTTRQQLYRSLRAILNGNPTAEHIEYVTDHIGDFEIPLSDISSQNLRVGRIDIKPL